MRLKVGERINHTEICRIEGACYVSYRIASAPIQCIILCLYNFLLLSVMQCVSPHNEECDLHLADFNNETRIRVFNFLPAYTPSARSTRRGYDNLGLQ